MKRLLFILVTFVTVLAGCVKDPKCTYNECDLKAPSTEIQDLQNYLTNNGIAATQHCSGVFYVIHQQGSGSYPSACGDATLYYKGTLTNGTVFDETKPNQPAAFNLAGLITGFKNGLLQVKAGGKMTMYIPPSLGYGNSPAGTIPANSILIFDVDLLSVK